MTKITAVLAVPATGAYYHTDHAALQDSPIPISGQYAAQAVTPGFRRVREIAQGVSVGLVLHPSSPSPSRPEDRAVVWGDCVSVAFGGMSGRDPPFRTADGLRTIRHVVAPALEGREVLSFCQLAADIETLTEVTEVPAPEPPDAPDSGPRQTAGLSRRDLLTAPLRFLLSEGTADRPGGADAPRSIETIAAERPLHTAIRYGVSQALLKAAAFTRGLTMAEIIAADWDLPRPSRAIPVHAQSGVRWRRNADKMIARRVASLPHGLVESIPEQLGTDGEELLRYVSWLRDRLRELAGPQYHPTIHLDVHGALGRIYDHNLGRVLGYLYRLEMLARPYPLRIESPVIMPTRAAQIETMKTLREYVQFRDIGVRIVADEWANTLDDVKAFIAAQAADMIHIKMPDLGGVHRSVEAVLACHRAGIGALLGGSCTETDLSARVTAHVALATRPNLVMAKPGMGVDEGISIIRNEMARSLAWIHLRSSGAKKTSPGDDLGDVSQPD